jgi:hypothetical protein
MPSSSRREVNSADSNCVPLSILVSPPKRHIQFSHSVLAQDFAEMSVNGNASGHLVNLSMAASRYCLPS